MTAVIAVDDMREPPTVARPVREAAKIERAYRQLREGILDGVYGPNERLVEAPLTQVLGISRNTLRTVLARLDHEGLIVLEPNRGGRVRAFSLDEAHDILQVRESIEGLVAALAASRRTAVQLAVLRETVEQMAAAIEGDDPMRYSALNTEFHRLLQDAAGSATAASVLASLHYPLIRFQFRTVLVPGRRAASLAEHRLILQAVEAGDPDAAERAARRHISHVRATLERSGRTD